MIRSKEKDFSIFQNSIEFFYSSFRFRNCLFQSLIKKKIIPLLLIKSNIYKLNYFLTILYLLSKYNFLFLDESLCE